MESARHRPSDPPTERRQVTVLFCDLVGSTEFGAGKDEEDLLDMIVGYQRCVSDVVAGFGGYVAKYMGDGALVYFGYPEAHEDDAERAVRAGLALCAAVRRLVLLDHARGPVPCPPLRVGIATGTVVVGERVGSGPAEERTIVGETPNLAARLQAVASPGAVVVARQTRRLIGDLFACRPIGPVLAKGFAEPLAAWEVVGANAVEGRFEALYAGGLGPPGRAPFGLTPLVGREKELARLRRRWERARGGQGQVVLLGGEAGMGKSRLAAALREQDWMPAVPHAPLRFNASPHDRGSVLHPFVAQLERAAGLHATGPSGAGPHGAAPEGRFARLEAALAPAALAGESLALLADLLSIPADGRPPPPRLAPHRRRERTFEAVLELLRGLARHGPLLLVFEDVHWFDPTSLDLLALVVARVRTLPALAVVTSRPEFEPPWAGQPHVTPLVLERLGQREAAEIVAWTAGSEARLDEITAEVVARADGVPLFVEELTKALLEARGGGAIPVTLQASLTARLDRLGPAAREVAQIGAAIGRDVSFDLLAAVAGPGGTDLHAALDELTRSGLMLRQAGARGVRYSFKHALIRDAAYGALLRRRRREIHAEIVGAIEAVEPEAPEREPGAMAHHCAEAGLFDRAIVYRLKAGRLAFKRSALAQSAEQLQEGLRLLDRVADPRARAAHELALQTALGGVLVAMRGYGDPTAGAAYARACDLCTVAADGPGAALALVGAFGHALIRGDLRSASRITDEVAGRANDGGMLLFLGHGFRGIVLTHAGDLAGGARMLRRAATVQRRADAATVPDDLAGFGVNVGGYLTWALIARGLLDQARRQEAELLAGFPLASRTFAAAGAGCYAVWNAQLRRDSDAASGMIAPLVDLCDEQGFAFWRAVALTAKGWAVARAGELARGVALLEEGLAAYRAIGSEFLRPLGTNALAEALLQAGETGRAIALLDETLAAVARNGDRWLEAETSRIKGAALVASGRDDAGEAYLSGAVRLARDQGALLWELRAGVRLADLWRGHGRRADARDLLRPIYERFREGWDSADLHAARALLDDLDARP